MQEKTVNLQLRFSKKSLIWFIVLLVVVVFGALELKYSLINQSMAYFNRASAKMIIIDKETKKPITAAIALSNDITGQTDTSGEVTLINLTKGDNNFEISKSGYVTSSISASLAKGANDLGTIELVGKKNLAKVTGKLEDAITKKPIAKALVSVSDATGNSTAIGTFELTQVTVQKTKIKVTVAGYLDYEKDLEIKDKAADAGTIDLVPNGKLIFTSDRDGSSAIYSSNLDGSEALKLIDNVNLDSEGGEGGPSYSYSTSFWMSPDAKHLAYSTNNEKSSSDKPKYLYVATVKGKEVKKLSEDANPYNIKWVNSSKIIYTTYSSGANNFGHAKTVDISTGNVVQLDEIVAQATYGYVSYVAVSPEGLIAYTASYTGADDKKGTYFINSDGSNRQRITDKQCNYGMSFSPDGETLYCQYYDNGNKKYVIDVSSLEIKEGDNPFSESGTNISPDGKKVIFVDNRDGQSNLFIKDIDGTNEKQLTTEGYVQSGTWSASGKMIAYITGKDGLFVKGISIDGGEGVKITSCNGSSLSLIDN